MKARHWIGLMALLAAGVATWVALKPSAFSGIAGSTGAGAAGPGVAPSQVTYELAWELGQATALGQGFSVEHPEGRVEVDSLAVVDTTVSLVSCSPPKPPTALLDWIIPTARAGHTLSPEAARRLGVVQVEAPHANSFRAGHIEVFGERVLDGSDRYCRVHWLVARGPTHGLHDLTAAGWAGVSLRISGRLVPAGPGSSPQPFAWETGMANGAFRELPAPLADGAPLRVRLVRRVDRLFDGLSFSDRAELLPRKVLSNLFLNTELLLNPD